MELSQKQKMLEVVGRGDSRLMVRLSWARKAVSNVFDGDCDSAGAGAGQLGPSREGGLDRQMLESFSFFFPQQWNDH